jgi:hypothetical protein
MTVWRPLHGSDDRLLVGPLAVKPVRHELSELQARMMQGCNRSGAVLGHFDPQTYLLLLHVPPTFISQYSARRQFRKQLFFRERTGTS